MQFVADSALEKAGAEEGVELEALQHVEESIYVVELPLLSLGRSRAAAMDLKLRAVPLETEDDDDEGHKKRLVAMKKKPGMCLQFFCSDVLDDLAEEDDDDEGKKDKKSSRVREVSRRWLRKSTVDLFPPLVWVPKLTKEVIKSDIVAGLTVGVMAIPQSMSYASIAGLEFVYGLYAAATPALTYAFVGGSGQLAVGPVALVSLLVEEGLRNQLKRSECRDFYEDDPVPEDTLAKECPGEYARLVHVCMLWVGVIQLGASLCRLGFVVNFLGHPVISGFTSAAAIIIAFSQLKSWFAVSVPKSQFAHDTFGALLGKVIRGKAKGVPFVLGLASWAVLYAVRRGSQKYPKRLGLLRPLGPLIVCVGATLLIVATGDSLRDNGVEVVGLIPRGLPRATISLVFRRFAQDAVRVFPTALSVSVIGFMESYAIATSLAAKAGQSLPSTRELRAVGLANVIGSFFSGYPVAGSFSRSAVANATGARTPLAGFITGCVLMLALVVMPDFARKLPNFVLASVVISSVVNLVAVEEAKRLWRVRKPDFLCWVIAFGGTLFLGVLNGLSIAVLVSLILVIAESVRPQISVLWKLPGTTVYRNVQQGESNGQFVDGVLVTRIGSSMYFANVAYVKETLLDLAKKYDRAVDRRRVHDYYTSQKASIVADDDLGDFDDPEQQHFEDVNDDDDEAPAAAKKDSEKEDEEKNGLPVPTTKKKMKKTRPTLPSSDTVVVDSRPGTIRYIVVEMTPVQSLDSTALHMIEELVKDLRRRGLNTVFASCGTNVEETMRRADIQRHVGYEWFHPNVNAAVEFCVRHRAATDALSEYAGLIGPAGDGSEPNYFGGKDDNNDDVNLTVLDNADDAADGDKDKKTTTPTTAGDIELQETPGSARRRASKKNLVPSIFRRGGSSYDQLQQQKKGQPIQDKKKNDDATKDKDARVLVLASKHRVVERTLDMDPLDNELLAPERRAIESYYRKDGDPTPVKKSSSKANVREAPVRAVVPHDKYAFLASRRAVIQRSAISTIDDKSAPVHEALAPAQVVAVVDSEVPDLMLNIVIDTLDRPFLMRDLGNTISQHLGYQIRFSEAAVVARRSISVWRCEVPRRGIPEVANAAMQAEIALKRSLAGKNNS